jgi:hypothetical protein
VVVDKYKWQTLVTPRARTWFLALVNDSGLPDHFSPSMMEWLWVAWLFGLEEHFRQLSKVAQQLFQRTLTNPVSSGPGHQIKITRR